MTSVAVSLTFVASGKWFEAGAAAACVIHACFVAPACFRWVPPDAAGRLFRILTRSILVPAALFALAAAGLRWRGLTNGLAPVASVALDCAAALCLVMALTALGRFEAARDLALRESAPGALPDGPAILRVFALLRGIRVLVLVAGILSVLASMFGVI